MGVTLFRKPHRKRVTTITRNIYYTVAHLVASTPAPGQLTRVPVNACYAKRSCCNFC